MEDKLKELWEKISQSIAEQPWAQEFKGKWDEIDAQSKLYIKVAAGALGVCLLIFATLSSMWNVHKLKQELAEKRNLLTMIRNSTEELRKLQDSLPASAAAKSESKDASGPWTPYFETLASNAGLEKANYSISSEKQGTSSDQSKEALFDIDLTHVNIKQVINLAVALENGQRPSKIRNMNITTKGDPTGYMDATLSVSGFTMVVSK